MRFLLDENVDVRLADYLSRLGHEVATLFHRFPKPLSDREVLSLSVSEDRILVTYDRHFGDLVFRQLQPHAGLILMRLSGLPFESKAEAISNLLEQSGHDLGHFFVLTPGGFRIRDRESMP